MRRPFGRKSLDASVIQNRRGNMLPFIDFIGTSSRFTSEYPRDVE